MTTRITNSDRAAVIREAWNRAYLAAVLAVEPVRQHIGAAMRSAWASFRQASAEGVILQRMTEAFEEQHARAGRAEARVYLKGLLAAKEAAAAAATSVDAVHEPAQLCMLTWIVDAAVRAGEPRLYAVDQVEPVAPVPVMATAKAPPVAEPAPVQLSILDLIEAEVPVLIGIPETVPADQDDEEALEQVVIEQVVDPRQELLDRIAHNDAAMDRLSERIKRDDALYGSGAGFIDQMYDSLDDLHTHGINLRDDLKELSSQIAHLPVAMVPQPVQQQQAKALSVDPRIGQLENLRARLKDIQWDVDNLTGLCHSTFRYGSDRANLDAQARLDEKWTERGDALNAVRRLEHALGIAPLTTR